LLPNHNLSNIPAEIATTTWPELLCVVAPYHKRIEFLVSPLQISATGVSLPLWMAWSKNLLSLRVAARLIKSHIIIHIYIYEPMAAWLIKLIS
jgi:hypothetical protein